MEQFHSAGNVRRFEFTVWLSYGAGLAASSAAGSPAYPSFRIATIRLSLNLLFLIGSLLSDWLHPLVSAVYLQGEVTITLQCVAYNACRMVWRVLSAGASVRLV